MTEEFAVLVIFALGLIFFINELIGFFKNRLSSLDKPLSLFYN